MHSLSLQIFNRQEMKQRIADRSKTSLICLSNQVLGKQYQFEFGTGNVHSVFLHRYEKNDDALYTKRHHRILQNMSTVKSSSLLAF